MELSSRWNSKLIPQEEDGSILFRCAPTQLQIQDHYNSFATYHIFLSFDPQMQSSLEKYLFADSVKLQLEEMVVVQNVKESMQVLNRGEHSFKSEKLEEAFHFVT